MRTETAQIKTLGKGIYTAHFEQLASLNKNLLQDFIRHQHDDGIKRSHLFNGRYENIYLDSRHIPALTEVINKACECAVHILQRDGVRAGYWFNHMPDGSVTTLHRHDDDDELLSAAYYVSVPARSGDLIIHAKSGPVRIQPEAGSFIFFYPDIAHEVTENRSGQNRLSIGINFGIKDPGTAN